MDTRYGVEFQKAGSQYCEQLCAEETQSNFLMLFRSRDISSRSVKTHVGTLYQTIKWIPGVSSSRIKWRQQGADGRFHLLLKVRKSRSLVH